MKIRAVPASLFHSIGEVAECFQCSFYRNGDDWTDALLCYDDIHLFRLESTENGLLTATGRFR